MFSSSCSYLRSALFGEIDFYKKRNRDYFMVGERVRFLFTSCGESPQRVNKNRTRELTMK